MVESSQHTAPIIDIMTIWKSLKYRFIFFFPKLKSIRFSPALAYSNAARFFLVAWRARSLFYMFAQKFSGLTELFSFSAIFSEFTGVFFCWIISSGTLSSFYWSYYFSSLKKHYFTLIHTANSMSSAGSHSLSLINYLRALSYEMPWRLSPSYWINSSN